MLTLEKCSSSSPNATDRALPGTPTADSVGPTFKNVGLARALSFQIHFTNGAESESAIGRFEVVSNVYAVLDLLADQDDVWFAG